jgi:Transcriptional regulatory protein, C terminal
MRGRGSENMLRGGRCKAVAKRRRCAASGSSGRDKQRALLAILLLHRNQVVSADRLISGLCGESPPAGAQRTLRAYVSKLRRAIGANGAAPSLTGDSEHRPTDGALLTRAHGYVLHVALCAKCDRPARGALPRGGGGARRGRSGTWPRGVAGYFRWFHAGCLLFCSQIAQISAKQTFANAQVVR